MSNALFTGVGPNPFVH